jgi:hypothetical protein
MSSRMRWAAGLAVCLLVVTVGVACSDDDDDDGGDGDTTPAASATAAGDTTPASGTVINVLLNEFSVVPDASTAPAGEITFLATNEGPDDEHEFVIIRSDLEPGALPTSEDGSVPESEVDLVDDIEGMGVCETGEVTVDLEAGAYVFICNLVQEEDDGTIESHYQKGMHRGFTVE